MTPLVDRELPDSIRYLSEKHEQGCTRRELGRTHLQIIGRNPAYICPTPPSRASLVKPLTRPVAYPRSDTRRMRVASNGVSRMSAKNLQRWLSSRLDAKHSVARTLRQRMRLGRWASYT